MPWGPARGAPRVAGRPLSGGAPRQAAGVALAAALADGTVARHAAAAAAADCAAARARLEASSRWEDKDFPCDARCVWGDAWSDTPAEQVRLSRGPEAGWL
jgi:hypothetical protein